MSLYKRIFLTIAIIIVMILLSTSSMMVRYQQRSMEQEFDYNMTANLSIIRSQLEQTVDDFLALGLSFSNNEAFIAYFESMDIQDDAMVNEALAMLRKIKASSELLNNVTLTPRDGVIRLDALGAFYDKGPDESKLEYYLELSGNPEMKSFINKPLIGTANNQPIFGIGIQMDNDGEFVGILGLPINFNRVMERSVIPDITDEDLEVLMFNTSGTIVWATRRDQIHNDEANMLIQAPGLYNTITESKSGDLQGDIFGINAQIKYDYYEVFDTYILVYKDMGPYNSRLAQSIVTIIGFSIGMLFVSGFALYAILLRITNPIYELVAYSNEVANENFEIEIPERITTRKDEIGQLGKAYGIMIHNINTSFKKIQSYGERYQFMANHDELTNLPNRRSFNDSVNRLHQHEHVGCVLMMDIDNFKKVNDTLGHIVGDKVLKEVGKELWNLGSDDIMVSRFGGDEFIVYVHENEDQTRTQRFVSNLLARFDQQMQIGDKSIEVKVSIGATYYPQNSNNLDELIRQSDIALYMAKKHGKNRVEYFDASMEKSVFEKVKIEKELSYAMKHDGFKLVYQPQVDLKTGKTTCYEALIRMKNSSYGPVDFIPVAEENLMIIDIGRWVVREAIEQIARWRDDGKGTMKVSVNFSGSQLRDTGFYGYLKEQLRENFIDGRYLELEVTENVLIEHQEQANSFFDQITSLGVDLSLDDFGSGYSSLTYMVSFPVKKIKLDRELIMKYLGDGKNNAIGKLISLVHSLGYVILAEGVEYRRDVDILVDGQCDLVQGYFFSKPKDPGTIVDVAKVYDLAKYETK